MEELAPRRMARTYRTLLEGKATEEVPALIYMQGVAEALDAFDLVELLRAEQGGASPPDIKA